MVKGAPIDRRSFLQKGAFGGALLLLGGAGLALYPSREIAPPTKPLKVLSARAFQTLIAIAARVVVAPDADPVAIAHTVDAGIAWVPIDVQREVEQLLGLFENALPGLLLDGRAMPFTRLEASAQDRVLERWRDSRLVLRRGAYNVLRKLCLGAHYGDPRAWKSIRYAGPPDTGGFLNDDSKAGTPEWLAANEGAKP